MSSLGTWTQARLGNAQLGFHLRGAFQPKSSMIRSSQVSMYLESQVAQNERPLYPKVAQQGFLGFMRRGPSIWVVIKIMVPKKRTIILTTTHIVEVGISRVNSGGIRWHQGSLSEVSSAAGYFTILASYRTLRVQSTYL